MTKDKYIQIRISKDNKELIKSYAKKQEKTISQFILDNVLTNNNGDARVNTSVNTMETKTLKKLLRSLFELMDNKMDFTTEPNKEDDKLIFKVMDLLGL